MKKTYIIKANSYQDAIKKVKRLSKYDGDFDRRDNTVLISCSDHLNDILDILRDVKQQLQTVDVPLNRTIDKCDEVTKVVSELRDMINDNVHYEDEFGHASLHNVNKTRRDSEDGKYKIVKKANSYLIMKDNWVVAQYETYEAAKKNLDNLNSGKGVLDDSRGQIKRR